MSQFDFGIGMSQKGLNQTSAALFKAAPDAFSGTAPVPDLPITARWVLPSAPTFDLAPSPTRTQALRDVVRKRLAEAGLDAATQQAAAEMVGTSVPTFSVVLHDLTITLSSKGQPDAVIKTTVTVVCHVTVEKGAIRLEPFDVTAPQLKDHTQNLIVQSVLCPKLKETLAAVLAGFGIPVPSVPGIRLSDPVVAVDQGRLVVVTNVARKGVPAPPAGFPWPAKDAFVVVGQDGLQAAAAALIPKDISDHGSGGKKLAGYEWSYTMSLSNPDISLSGTDVHVAMHLDGNVGGAARIVGVRIPLGFDAKAVPKPSGTGAVAIEGDQVSVVVRKVDTFTLVVTPAGSVPSKVAGWMIEGIVQAVVGSATALTTTFIRNVKIGVAKLPTFTASLDKTTFRVSPVDVDVVAAGDAIAVQGAIGIK